MLKVSILLLAALLASQPVRADEQLVIAFDNASVPTQYADPTGQAAGVYPAIVRRAFALMGEPVRLVAVPFLRVAQNLETGNGAAGGAVMTPSRLAVGDYSAAYFVEQVNVYQRASRYQAYVDVRSFNGKTVGVIRGWAYGAEFDNARQADMFRAEAVGQDAQNFAKLAIGRLDFVVATALSGQLAQAQPGFPVLTVADRPLVSIPIHLVISKKRQGTALVRRFNAAIASMKASGEINLIASAEIERARVALASTGAASSRESRRSMP